MPGHSGGPRPYHRPLDLGPRIPATEIRADESDVGTYDFQSIPLKSLVVGRPVYMDLYLPVPVARSNQVSMTRIIEAFEVFSSGHRQVARKHGLSHVYLPVEHLPQYLTYVKEVTEEVVDDPEVSTKVKAEIVYDNATQIVREAMAEPRLGHNIEVGQQYVKTVVRFVTEMPEAIECLTQMMVIDYSVYTHSVNVCLLTAAFAHFLGLPSDKVNDIGMGGLLHDVGKNRIPENILKKTAGLDREEWEIIKSHPASGFRLLRNSVQLAPDTLRMIYQHHENFDGTGYPRGLRQEQISTASRMIRLIDAYDAITAERCYKAAVPPFKAIKVMLREMAGRIWSPLFEPFIVFLGQIAGGDFKSRRITAGEGVIRLVGYGRERGIVHLRPAGERSQPVLPGPIPGPTGHRSRLQAGG